MNMENTDLTAATIPPEDIGSEKGVQPPSLREGDRREAVEGVKKLPLSPQAATSPSTRGTGTFLGEAGEERETNEPSGDGLQESAFCLPVKFNKQDYQLNLEEATAYAQKGMKFDTVEPMLDKLKTLAQQHGLGVRELVDTLCGEDTPAISDEERLANDFCRLREECPDVKAFDALPESVIRTALDEGISLLDAYLRHEHRERVRVLAATDAARKAGASSAGAQRSELIPTPDPAVEAMISGVRGGASQ